MFSSKTSFQTLLIYHTPTNGHMSPYKLVNEMTGFRMHDGVFIAGSGKDAAAGRPDLVKL
jgi:hypothetical protein